jgi:hypothetical protein
MAHRADPLPIAAVGYALTAALVSLFVVVLLLGLLVPLPHAHGLVGVFADAAVNAVPFGLDGIVAILSAALTAIAAGIAYLRVIVR